MLASSMNLRSTVSLRGTAVAARPVAATVTARPAALVVSARYRGVGTDLSKVPLVARSPADSGSTEAQVARLSARVIQLTAHLKEHKKDYGATRGLMAILGQRRRLLRYLFKNDRQCYEKTIATLNVRPLKAQSSRGVFVKLGGAAATAAAEGTQ